MSLVSLDLDLSTRVPPPAAAPSAIPLCPPEFTSHALGRFGGRGVIEVMEGGVGGGSSGGLQNKKSGGNKMGGRGKKEKNSWEKRGGNMEVQHLNVRGGFKAEGVVG